MAEKTLAEVTAAAGRARMKKLGPEGRKALSALGHAVRWGASTAAERKLAKALKQAEGRRGKAPSEEPCRTEGPA